MKCFNHYNGQMLEDGFMMVKRHGQWYGISEANALNGDVYRYMRLLQYCNAIDKDDTPIYEGDVMLINGELHLISYNTIYGFPQGHCYFQDEEKIGITSTPLSRSDAIKGTIIGNVFTARDMEDVHSSLYAKADREIGSDMEFIDRNHNITRTWNPVLKKMYYDDQIRDRARWDVDTDITYMYGGTGPGEMPVYSTMHKINQRDRRRKDIYEGDIVKCRQGWLGEVKFMGGEPVCEEIVTQTVNSHGPIFDQWDELEIIGNKYEHKHLYYHVRDNRSEYDSSQNRPRKVIFGPSEEPKTFTAKQCLEMDHLSEKVEEFLTDMKSRRDVLKTSDYISLLPTEPKWPSERAERALAAIKKTCAKGIPKGEITVFAANSGGGRSRVDGIEPILSDDVGMYYVKSKDDSTRSGMSYIHNVRKSRDPYDRVRHDIMRSRFWSEKFLLPKNLGDGEWLDTTMTQIVNSKVHLGFRGRPDTVRTICFHYEVAQMMIAHKMGLPLNKFRLVSDHVHRAAALAGALYYVDTAYSDGDAWVDRLRLTRGTPIYDKIMQYHDQIFDCEDILKLYDETMAKYR